MAYLLDADWGIQAQIGRQHAATALHHNLTVLTYNRRHFEQVPSIRLYSIDDR